MGDTLHGNIRVTPQFSEVYEGPVTLSISRWPLQS